MIESLRINGFRGLDALDVGPLGRINVVVGPGGCGKTNLLEALFLFCENGNPTGLITGLQQRGMPATNKTAAEIDDLLSWFASRGNARREASIQGVLGGLDRKVSLRHTTLPSPILLPSSSLAQDADAHIAQAIAVFEMKTDHGESHWEGSLYVTPQGLVHRSAPAPAFPARFHGVTAHRGASEPLAPLWSQVEDRGESSQVEDLLRLFDPGIDSIRVAAGQSSSAYLRVLHRRLGRVPLELLGDGFSKALCVACNLVAAAGGLLLIDEFDVSLHVGFLRTLAEFVIAGARRLDVQIVLSTHSLDMLDAFIDLTEAKDDLHVLRMGRPEAKTRLHNIDREQARSLREDIGFDLRRAG